MKKDYFEEYKHAKIVLNQLMCQFYSYDISKEEAENFNIKYTEDDIFNSLGNVSCAFHKYNPEAMYIWDKLGITEPIVLMRKMWNNRINFEIKDETKDYYKEYLELKIVALHIVCRYYKATMSKENADKYKIEYDPDYDLDDDVILGCNHLFESAGENAWDLFDFDESFIALSKFDKLIEEISDELNKLDMIKQKKIGAKYDR